MACKRSPVRIRHSPPKNPTNCGIFYAAMFFVYILYSVSSDKYYIGSCEDLSMRINQQNTGRNISTKHGLPWIIKYTEQFETRTEALRREKEIKIRKVENNVLCY